MELDQPEFQLTQLELSSSLWRKIAGHLQDRLQVMREKNDSNLTEAETYRLRGRIEEAKRMLKLGDAPETYQ